MKHTLLVVSCLSLGLGAAAGCGAKSHSSASAGTSRSYQSSAFAREDAGSFAQPRLKGAAVGNYNKGYVDGVNASAFFNKGQPLTDEQVNRLIEIGHRQGDPTGLLALNGYPEGYRAGAKHAHNPYEKQMTGEQVAQVRKAQGLPVEPVQVKPEVTKRTETASNNGSGKKQAKKDRKSKKESAEASARD
jgi:hypothetical protein